MGFDVWLKAGSDAQFKAITNHGDLSVALADIGINPTVLEAGGLARRLTVQKLPDTPLSPALQFTKEVTLNETGDTPIWIAVTTEDGFQAWSSPIYAFRQS